MAQTSDDEHKAALLGEPTPIIRVVIEDYDPQWPEWYATESQAIRSVLEQHVLVNVEHTGSTSVPGLAAKPVIDMLLVVADAAAEDRYVPALESIGYRLTAREPAWYDHRFLRRRTDEGAPYDVNLHVFPPTAETEINRMLAFRDWLRDHEEDRSYYERTKRHLAQREWTYLIHYSNAKSDVVEEILARALQDRDGS